ncbi:alpha/beta hydrolase [Streptomyces umbrinus]|uniref:alpha/beta hydrolase n=1 Tax=Streptomyces umbrinus TaxID=67370 RepID=UPI003C30C8B6
MASTSITFPSDGHQLAGDLYLPDDITTPVPAVVMAAGFGGVKEMLMPPYAAALNKAGIAVLAYDYASFGSSEGEPRQHMDLDAQQRSYRHALDYLTACGDIDTSLLGVFGTSMSGGHALALAASDTRVSSAVVLVPFTGLDTSTLDPGLLDMFEDAARRQAAGEQPAMIASTGKPGDIAAMTSDGAWEWMERMTADAPTFRNEVTLASLWNLANYHPTGNLGAITCPVHAVLATDDAITPASAARLALSQIERLEIVEIPQTHFELFTDHLQETIDLASRWFAHDLHATS